MPPSERIHAPDPVSSKRGRKPYAGLDARVARSAAFLAGLFLLLNPFPRITSVKEICFYSAVAALFVLVVRRRADLAPKTPLFAPFALFAVWAYTGVFFALDPVHSLGDLYAHLFKYLLLYAVLTTFLCSEKGVVTLAWVVTVSGALFTLTGLVYYYGFLGHPLSTRFGLHLTGGRDVFGETPTNLMGVLTAFAVLLDIQLLRSTRRFSLRALLWAFLPPLLAATVLTQTRGTLIALLVGIVVLFLHNKKAIAAVVCTALAVVLLTPVRDRITVDRIFGNERIGLLLMTLEIVKDHPVTGTGFGLQTFDQAIDQHAYNLRLPEKHRLDQPFGAPHNMYADVAMRTGLAGFALMAWAIVAAVRMGFGLVRAGTTAFVRAWGLCAWAVLWMFLVKGFFEPMFSHFTETLATTLLAMIGILHGLNASRPGSSGPPTPKAAP